MVVAFAVGMMQPKASGQQLIVVMVRRKVGLLAIPEIQKVSSIDNTRPETIRRCACRPEST